MNIDILVTLAIGIIASYLGWKIRHTEIRMGKTMSKDEIREFIDLKIAPVLIQNEAIEDRLDRLESKIDHLITLATAS